MTAAESRNMKRGKPVRLTEKGMMSMQLGQRRGIFIGSTYNSFCRVLWDKHDTTINTYHHDFVEKTI